MPTPTALHLLAALLAASPLVGLAPDARAQHHVVVLVRDAETRAPLPGASVVAGDAGAATDANGRVRFVVDADSVAIGAAYLGYAPVDTTVAVTPGANTYVVLGLAPGGVRALGDVVVTAETLNRRRLERIGFFDRKDSHTGAFLTRADLDARNVSQFSDIFRGMNGVRIDRGRGLSRLVSTRRRDCPMTVFIDGTEAAYLSDNVDSLPFGDVAAVEVYRGPSEVPMAYAHTRFRNTCGAVLIWTQIEIDG
ncbi:carboxypeptidase regulatory-like domain-containing protein [Rubrivirga sp. IMCC45206]|uniref:carboxypeptidase regulatory-like domain-containing protein n=1 Tax=Rubrivirga sp. IMCC45206 TaxID=3391614 RepID=UPI00398FC739